MVQCISSLMVVRLTWWSLWAFFREFQQNSRTATMIARLSPQSSTTNTPPMFFTLRGFAFESLLLS